MNTIIYRLVQAFSWMLIHSLWEGLLLAIITGVVLMLTKRTSPVIRYNLVLSQLLLFIITCTFTFVWEWRQEQLQPLTRVIAFPLLHVNTDVIREFTQTCVRYFSANAPMILLLWGILFAARAVKMMGGLIYIRRARNKSIYAADDYWKEKIVVLSERLQLKKAVTLLESGYVKMPLVIGHFKPVILIPLGLLAGLPTAQVEAVLLHELAHIRRNDYFVNLLQNITEAIFFFNPGLLWISSLLRDEREHCCDDIALAQTKNKREFIEALISFKEHSLHGGNYAMAFPGHKNHLLQRVSRILHNKNNTLNPVEKVSVMMGILLLSVMVTTAGVMQIKTIVHNKPVVDTVVAPTASGPVVVKKKKHIVKVSVQKKEVDEVYLPDQKRIEDKLVLADGKRQNTAAENAKLQALEAHREAELDRAQAQLDKLQAQKDREQADGDRRQADRDRAQAVKDRLQADKDREQARLDRIEADKDRLQAMKERLNNN